MLMVEFDEEDRALIARALNCKSFVVEHHPLGDALTLKHGNGVYDLIWRDTFTGEVTRHDGLELDQIARVRDGAARRGHRKWDEGVAIVPPFGLYRGWSYILPEPETAFGQTPPSPPDGLELLRTNGTLGGPTFAERHPQGYWAIYATAEDWQKGAPFACVSPDVPLLVVYAIARARVWFGDEMADSLTRGHEAPADHRNLHHIGILEEALDPEAMILMTDLGHRMIVDRAMEAHRVAARADFIASVAPLDRRAAELVAIAADYAYAAARQARREPVPPVAIMCHVEGSRMGATTQRFEFAWELATASGPDELLAVLLGSGEVRAMMPVLMAGLGLGPVRAERPFSMPEKAPWPSLPPEVIGRLRSAADLAGYDLCL